MKTRLTLLLAFLAFFLLFLPVFCLQAQPQPQTLSLYTPAPSAVTQANGTYTGQVFSGTLPIYYWVVARYPSGTAAPFGPISVPNTPGVQNLNAQRFVTVTWAQVSGATSYDVIRSTTPSYPAPCNDCAISLANTGASFVDNSPSPGGAYPPAGVPNVAASNATMRIENIAQANPFINVTLNGSNFQMALVTPGASLISAQSPQAGDCVEFLNATTITTSGAPCVSGGLPDPGSSGMVARTALNTTAARSITGTTNQVNVTNGNGVTGDPVVSIANNPVLPGTPSTGSGNISANASTASALAANPADCAANNFANAIGANGDLGCAQVTTNSVAGANKRGNGTQFQITTGSVTTDNCAKFDANGNIVDAGAACSAGGTTYTWPYQTISGVDYVAGSFPVTRPVPANWTSVNLGTSVRTNAASGAITLLGQADAQWHMVCTPLPAVPYTIRLALLLTPSIVESNLRAAILWRNSGSGTLEAISARSGGGSVIEWTDWTSVSSLAATNTSNTFYSTPPVFYIQLQDDNTNRIIRLWDGTKAYNPFTGTNWQEPRTTFLTPDQVCFGVFSDNGNFAPYATLVGYSPN